MQLFTQECLTTFPSTSKLVINTLLPVVFWTLFSVFRNVVKNGLSYLIYFSPPPPSFPIHISSLVRQLIRQYSLSNPLKPNFPKMLLLTVKSVFWLPWRYMGLTFADKAKIRYTNVQYFNVAHEHNPNFYYIFLRLPVPNFLLPLAPNNSYNGLFYHHFWKKRWYHVFQLASLECCWYRQPTVVHNRYIHVSKWRPSQ